MKKKILWLGLIFLLLAALVLASCGEAVPGEQEEEEEEAGRFEGTEIYFISGADGCTFNAVVCKGMRDAAEDFGVDLKIYFTEWNPAIMIDKFKEAVALEPDGIIVAGFTAEEAIKPHIDAALAKGIIVTTWNTDIPGLEELYSAQGFGFVGAHNYSAGHLLGTETAKRFNLGPGDKAMVWGLLHQPVRGLRSKGCIDGLEEAGLTVDYLVISDAVNADPALGTPILAAYLAANPDTDVVVFDHGGLTAAAGKYFEAAGYAPDEILGVGFDISIASVAAIKTGYTDLILDQQQWLQGYLPVLQICLTKYAGFSGLHINTGAGFVDMENVDEVSALADQLIR